MRPTEPTLPGKATDERDNAPANAAVVTVRPPAEIMTKQQVPYFFGKWVSTTIRLVEISLPSGCQVE